MAVMKRAVFNHVLNTYKNGNSDNKAKVVRYSETFPAYIGWTDVASEVINPHNKIGIPPATNGQLYMYFVGGQIKLVPYKWLDFITTDDVYLTTGTDILKKFSKPAKSADGQRTGAGTNWIKVKVALKESAPSSLIAMQVTKQDFNNAQLFDNSVPTYETINPAVSNNHDSDFVVIDTTTINNASPVVEVYNAYAFATIFDMRTFPDQVNSGCKSLALAKFEAPEVLPGNITLIPKEGAVNLLKTIDKYMSQFGVKIINYEKLSKKFNKIEVDLNSTSSAVIKPPVVIPFSLSENSSANSFTITLSSDEDIRQFIKGKVRKYSVIRNCIRGTTSDGQNYIDLGSTITKELLS